MALQMVPKVRVVQEGIVNLLPKHIWTRTQSETSYANSRTKALFVKPAPMIRTHGRQRPTRFYHIRRFSRSGETSALCSLRPAASGRCFVQPKANFLRSYPQWVRSPQYQGGRSADSTDPQWVQSYRLFPDDPR